MKISKTSHADPNNTHAKTGPDCDPIFALQTAMIYANTNQLTHIAIVDRSTITARCTTWALRITMEFPGLNPANPLPAEMTRPASEMDASHSEMDATPKEKFSVWQHSDEPFQSDLISDLINPWDKHRIRKLRMECRGYKRCGKTHTHMSQSEFAKRLGVTSKCVSDWESGRYQPVKRYQERLENLAQLVEKRKASNQ